MEVWTFLPNFESYFVAYKNSFNSFFHLLQASDKFSWWNLSDLAAGNLSIIGDWESDEEVTNEAQNSTN